MEAQPSRLTRVRGEDWQGVVRRFCQRPHSLDRLFFALVHSSLLCSIAWMLLQCVRLLKNQVFL